MTFVELVKNLAEERGEEGSLGTNRECLARDLWKIALGRTDTIVKQGCVKEQFIPPTRWATELLVELLQADEAGNQDTATHELLKDLKKLVEADKLNSEFLDD